MNYHADNSQSIGETPLIQLRKVVDVDRALVLGKIEGRNPAYSVKCRIGAAMIWDAEARGKLFPGMEIIEPTSGNTGIALAFVGASRGYKVTLVMPESMSAERRKILKAFGANIILTEASAGMTGAVAKASEIISSEPKKYFMPDQFANPANPDIHFRTTGPEIWKDTDGKVDVVIAGVGTGGTITGVSRYLKNARKKRIISVGVEPEKSPLISQKIGGKALKPGKHAIQGIGPGFIPDVLDLSMIDRVETVSDEEAADFARRLSSQEGIFSGISSGAAVAVAARLVKEPEFKGRTIVVILPDSGERYLSTNLFEGF